MPRFYFHILDGSALFDFTGVELPGIDAAMTEAVRFAGAVLRDGIADEIWKGSPWRVVVSDSPSWGAQYPDPDLVGSSEGCPTCPEHSRCRC
jgi:hypothetical protein